MGKIFIMQIVCFAALVTMTVAMGSVNAAQTAEICINRLAAALEQSAVPQPILDLVESVESVHPFNGPNAWDELDRADVEKQFGKYPKISCETYADQINDLFTDILAEDQCDEVLESDDEAYESARNHEIIGPVLKAKEACFVFEPHLSRDGLDI